MKLPVSCYITILQKWALSAFRIIFISLLLLIFPSTQMFRECLQLWFLQSREIWHSADLPPNASAAHEILRTPFSRKHWRSTGLPVSFGWQPFWSILIHTHRPPDGSPRCGSCQRRMLVNTRHNLRYRRQSTIPRLSQCVWNVYTNPLSSLGTCMTLSVSSEGRGMHDQDIFLSLFRMRTQMLPAAFWKLEIFFVRPLFVLFVYLFVVFFCRTIRIIPIMRFERCFWIFLSRHNNYILA